MKRAIHIMLKVTVTALAGVFIVAAALWILIASGLLNQKIVQLANRQASNFIDGKLTINALEGNLLSSFTLYDLSLTTHSGEVVKIGAIHLDYSPLKAIRKRIQVNKLQIDGFEAQMLQLNDSSWNVEHLLLPSTADTTETPAESSPFNWFLAVDSLLLNNFSASITPLDTAALIPRRLNGNIALSGSYSADSANVKLLRMNLESGQPDLKLDTLLLEITMRDSLIIWRNLILRLGSSRMASQGSFSLSNLNQTSGRLTIAPLQIEDFRPFLKDIPLRGAPNITIELKGSDEKIELSALIDRAPQKLTMEGWIVANLNNPTYDLTLDALKINAAAWTGIDSLQTDITGNLRAAGQGIDPKTATLKLEGVFPNVAYNQYQLTSLRIDGQKEHDNAAATITTNTWFGHVMAQTSIGNIFATPNYTYRIETKNIDIKKLLTEKPFTSNLNLQATGEGEGFDLKTIKSRVRIRSTGSTINGKPIDDFDTQLAYNRGKYAIDSLHLHSPYFKLDLNGKGDLRNQNRLKFNIETTDINDLLHRLGITGIALGGKIAGEVSGSFFQFDLTTQAEIDSLRYDSLGTLRNAHIALSTHKTDSLRVAVELQAEQAQMDTLAFTGIASTINLAFDRSLKGEATAETKQLLVGKKSAGKAAATIRIDSEKLLQGTLQLQADSIDFAGATVRKTVTNALFRLADSELTQKINESTALFLKNYTPGELMPLITALRRDTIEMEANLMAETATWQSYSAARLTTTVNASLVDSLYSGALKAEVDTIRLGTIPMRKTTLETDFSNKNILNRLAIDLNDSLAAKLDADIRLAANPEIELRRTELQTGKMLWKNRTPQARITLYGDSIVAEPFGLETAGGQFMELAGTIAFKGKENFNVALKGINLERLNQLAALPYPINGYLDGKVRLGGTSAKPIINGMVSLRKIKLDTFLIDSLTSRIDFDGERLAAHAALTMNERQPFVAEATLPLELSLEKATTIPETGVPIGGKITLDKLQLAMFQLFLPPQMQFRGIASSELELGGKLVNPKLTGSIGLTQGQFRYNEFGINYKDIELDARMMNDSLVINQMKSDSGRGMLNLLGYVTFHPDSLFVPDKLSLDLTGKEFKALDSEAMQASLNTALKIAGNWPSPTFEGNMEVLQAMVNADSMIARVSGVSEIEDEPMLIEALKGDEKLQERKPAPTETSLVPLPDFMNLNGEFKLTVPGNFWVKGKSMNLELKGDLRALAENNLVSIIGDLNVKRGYYEIMGKRFEFNKGVITLSGGSELNPIFDFDIFYSFRDIESQMRKLELQMTGRIDDPTLSFKLDGKNIDEKDALSWLIFNKSPEQLSEGQKSTTDKSSAGMAANLAFGQLSGLLTQTMQKALRLDVIEITSSDNLDQTSLKAGKYLTDNLFVEIEQTIALDKKTKVLDPTKLTLEYQIIRGLFLDAVDQGSKSGIDLKLKRDFK